MYDKRNSDFLDLSRRLNFEGNPELSTAANVTIAEDGSKSGEASDANLAPRVSIYESDALFWLVSSLMSGNWMNLLTRCAQQGGEPKLMQ